MNYVKLYMSDNKKYRNPDPNGRLLIDCFTCGKSYMISQNIIHQIMFIEKTKRR